MNTKQTIKRYLLALIPLYILLALCTHQHAARAGTTLVDLAGNYMGWLPFPKDREITVRVPTFSNGFVRFPTPSPFTPVPTPVAYRPL
jgi:hypothetical protein